MAKVGQIISCVLVGILKIYQYVISPFLINRCRFYPSCSSYAITAITRHGLFYGNYLIIRRLLRCHPFHTGGVDEVPRAKRSCHQPCDINNDTSK